MLKLSIRPFVIARVTETALSPSRSTIGVAGAMSLGMVRSLGSMIPLSQAVCRFAAPQSFHLHLSDGMQCLILRRD